MYNFVLGYDGDINNMIYFPLTLDNFKTAIKSLNKVVETVKDNQMTIVKGIPLRDFSFKVLLPKNNFLVDNKNVWQEPIRYLARIREFKANKKPLRFILLRPQEDGSELFEGNLLVTLEEYNVEEIAGEEGDFYIDIKLKEYNPVTVKNTIVESNNNGTTKIAQNNVRPTKEPAKTYTVRKGDTLWTIAQKQLGNGDKWKDLKNINNINDQQTLTEGMVIRLQ